MAHMYIISSIFKKTFSFISYHPVRVSMTLERHIQRYEIDFKERSIVFKECIRLCSKFHFTKSFNTHHCDLSIDGGALLAAELHMSPLQAIPQTIQLEK
jgi:hypothetical protein